MKKTNVILVLVVVVVTGLWWWLSRDKAPLPNEAVDNPSVEAGQQAPLPQQRRPTATQPTETRSPTNQAGQPMSDADLEAHWRKSVAEQTVQKREFEQKWKSQLSAPINFFGKVVDENDQPVAGAIVGFSWNDLPPEEETREYTGENFTPFAYMHSSKGQTTSDAQGLFSLLDKKGKNLSVAISKTGYYSTGDARLRTFEYGDPLMGIFTPDSSNPVIFHLRKKGPGVDLVTSQFGVSPLLEVKAPRDGTPVQVDMLERKSGQGPLTISQSKPPYESWKQASEWAFRMEIPDGGFVEHKDEFPFEAPESGYQPAIQFNFRQGQTNWTITLQKDYYIKFGNPPRYGRLHLETSIQMQGARLTYAINRTGSRNLEPK
jgi:hypothetical protein